MAIRVALHHTTRYAYDRPVRLSPHVMRLRPAPHCRTTIRAYSLRVTPEEHFLNWQQDPFGNHLARVVVPNPTDELVVDVDLVADLVTINPFDFFLDEYAERIPFEYEPQLAKELFSYLAPVESRGEVAAFVRKARKEIFHAGRRTIDVLVDLNNLVQQSLRYDIRMDPGVFAPDETLARGHGSCRDFAWLLVDVLRRLGFAARFVSGYSIQVRPDQKPLEGPAGVEIDCTDLHAWAEAYVPGAGWIGLDATSGLLCGEGHIPLACTPDPPSAAAITGSFSFAKRSEKDRVEERFEFEMRVARIEDRPRPTRSYTDEQWTDILACGDRVERALVESDVRLTMGGEPTFVSIDDMEGAEWSTEALGSKKLELADVLARRLLHRFAPGGLLHHGQGKWYPGESLPRWAESIYFRRDGEPMWVDPRLLSAAGAGRHDESDARKLIRAIADRIGVGPAHVMPGYEDAWYYLWRERRLPINVDPFDSKLEDEEERARLRRVFSNRLDREVGFALPLRSVDLADDDWAWTSGPWFLRDERLWLIPGDSPMGLRLPLESLPWSSPADILRDWERDPFASRPLLRSRATLPRHPSRKAGPFAPESPRRLESAVDTVRSAICVEPRDGILHVFMPPVGKLEHYLDLLAAIEDCVGELGVTARIEGYHPPSDPRLQRIQLTPDPGVLEVNIHPAASWTELVSNTTGLYEDARASRLGTDKFMLDGRHTGTGGGNHVVIGGPTAADSPLLRRPDLLRSFVSFWLNHPSLSYLFSGLFVGPTSQAPRLDEARQDQLYELEIALARLAPSADAPPWLVDRVLRHLLVDVTGNTHRTELCIDKLYNPDTATGRQGLLELRAFEMPPDARMSCAQQLLVRALVAWFWKEPYERRLVRWGTALHDRFMLPHFVWQDLEGVVDEVNASGHELRAEWFLPHWEFRFPRYGTVDAQGMELELRQAIEPWHVLGEEQGAGGTARYVDSSIERLQARITGLTESRYAVACNGRRLPLQPTGRAGEYVAGVRFKAWKPPSSLHPTLDACSALVFDLVDTWSDRAIAGCSYHVAHPGGRSYDVFPKNGLEAESRRIARFFPFGHTPGGATAPDEERNLEHPFTLDLRRDRP